MSDCKRMTQLWKREGINYMIDRSSKSAEALGRMEKRDTPYANLIRTNANAWAKAAEAFAAEYEREAKVKTQ